MSPVCKKCKGAGIVGLGLSFILYCPVDIKKHKCPHLPDHQHIHQEISLPPEFLNSMITVATSSTSVDHPYKIYEREDPDRKGNKIYILDVTPIIPKST